MLSSLSSTASCSLPNHVHRGLPSDAPRSLFSRSLIAIRKGCCSVAAASPERSLEASWIPAEGNAGDGYGGWDVRKVQMDDRKDHLKLVISGVGTSVAILLAVLTYQSASRKGFQFRIGVPLHAVLPRFRSNESKNAECTGPSVYQVSETKLDDESVVSDTSGLDENSVSAMQERKSKIIHVAADSTQRVALFVLKKLKYIKTNVINHCA